MSMYNARESSTNVCIFTLVFLGLSTSFFFFYLLYKVRDVSHDNCDNCDN